MLTPEQKKTQIRKHKNKLFAKRNRKRHKKFFIRLQVAFVQTINALCFPDNENKRCNKVLDILKSQDKDTRMKHVENPDVQKLLKCWEKNQLIVKKENLPVYSLKECVEFAFDNLPCTDSEYDSDSEYTLYSDSKCMSESSSESSEFVSNYRLKV